MARGSRGFGIPASGDATMVAEVARRVEELGYTTLWSNDNPDADGLATLAEAARVTNSIRLGVGVVACDRRPIEDVTAAIESLELPRSRLVLGIGAGFSSTPLRDVETAVARARDRTGGAVRIAVAAMGPRMCSLAGSVADTVLLNWMTPRRIEWARELIGTAAEVASYVRVAVDSEGPFRLALEAEGLRGDATLRAAFRTSKDDPCSGRGCGGARRRTGSARPV